MYVFKPSKFVRTKNVGSGKMLPLNAIPVKTHKILQLEDDLGCLVFYIVIYSMGIRHRILITCFYPTSELIGSQAKPTIPILSNVV